LFRNNGADKKIGFIYKKIYVIMIPRCFTATAGFFEAPGEDLLAADFVSGIF
jgi:hypothetical protein